MTFAITFAAKLLPGDGHFVMHGNYPAAVVSMFVPPQPNIFADCMRVLTTNPELNFRHNVITEYVYLDQDKVRKKLDKRIRQVSRANKGTSRHGYFRRPQGNGANSPPFAKKSLATPRLSLRHASTLSFIAKPQPTKNNYALHCATSIATVSSSSLPFAASPAPKQIVKNR